MKKRLTRLWWLIKTAWALWGKFRPIELTDEEFTRLVIDDPRFMYADCILEDGTTVQREGNSHTITGPGANRCDEPEGWLP